ncbi:hypothetical protein [Alkalicoccus halolimnae]|uniref:General stress protein n=1 Tax=Alkalicoccus halolimnae TaxID=1667239 RepID=A0A5C7FKP9_9BACI|nr:hypothetical protein [Alkalicoccus halolimnae]TXF85395.1 hypothetical protein FTX54_09460 [Alkalicoccus halolimnae]
MKELERRLIYLFTGEFSSMGIFIIIYVSYDVNPNNSLSLIYVFIVLNFILFQAGFYWFIKWRRMKTEKTIFPKLYKVLNLCKKVNLALIGAAPIFILSEIVFLNRVSYFEFSLMMLIYVFTVIEHINYYHIQLTNYKKGRGSRPSIDKEINRDYRQGG